MVDQCAAEHGVTLIVSANPYGVVTSPHRSTHHRGETRMTSQYGSRLRFRKWMTERDLDEETADAILESMPPFDWSDIARKGDMDASFDRVDQRFATVDQRFATVDERFDKIDERFDKIDERFQRADERFDTLSFRMDTRFDGLQTQISSLASDFHAMSRAVVLAVMAMAVTLAVLVLTVGVAALNT